MRLGFKKLSSLFLNYPYSIYWLVPQFRQSLYIKQSQYKLPIFQFLNFLLNTVADLLRSEEADGGNNEKATWVQVDIMKNKNWNENVIQTFYIF